MANHTLYMNQTIIITIRYCILMHIGTYNYNHNINLINNINIVLGAYCEKTTMIRNDIKKNPLTLLQQIR